VNIVTGFIVKWATHHPICKRFVLLFALVYIVLLDIWMHRTIRVHFAVVYTVLYLIFGCTKRIKGKEYGNKLLQC